MAYSARSNLGHSTVQQYLKGLRDFDVRGGCADFASRVHWPSMYRTLKDIKRADHHGSVKKAPISRDMILAYKVMVMTRPADVAIWACVIITFFGFFRMSNTTVAGGAPDAQGKCLRVQGVVILEREYGQSITAPSSKTRLWACPHHLRGRHAGPSVGSCCGVAGARPYARCRALVSGRARRFVSR